ncbi:MAG: PaaI family thioesterase [Elusimicrobia bacterium]|nr:MAG: PaaI family thioesterase [Elusimicrobiota bacterium]
MEAQSFSGVLGLHFTRATEDEVLAELTVSERHHQPYGVVHGGVYASIIETLASVGAGVRAFALNKTVLGLENHTSFLRAVRQGRLRARGTPLSRGRRSQVWEVAIQDDSGALVATGRVRLLLLDPEAQVAGTTLGFARNPATATGSAKTTDSTARRDQGKGETP